MANIGIIGTGWGARVQVPAFRKAGLEVIAIAGRDAERTRETGEKLEISRAYSDWRELVQDPDVELVTVVTPPATHKEMALEILRAGKHLVSEKPTQ